MHSNQGFSVCDLDPGLSHTPLRHLYVLNRVFLRHLSVCVSAVPDNHGTGGRWRRDNPVFILCHRAVCAGCVENTAELQVPLTLHLWRLGEGFAGPARLGCGCIVLVADRFAACS